jgi:hypothetical protein
MRGILFEAGYRRAFGGGWFKPHNGITHGVVRRLNELGLMDIDESFEGFICTINDKGEKYLSEMTKD